MSFTLGNLPCWRDPSFLSYFGDAALSENALEGQGSGSAGIRGIIAMRKALGAASSRKDMQVLDQTERCYFDQVDELLDGANTILKDLPVASDSDDLFHSFLRRFLPRVQLLKQGGMLVVPGGWIREVGGSTHWIFCVLHRKTAEHVTVTVVNTKEREGLEQYHPITVGVAACDYKLALPVDDVPFARLTSSSFWFYFFRGLVYPGKQGPKFLYEILLPYLGGRDLQSNQSLTAPYSPALDVIRAPTAEWKSPPRLGDNELLHCVMETAMHMFRTLRLNPRKLQFVHLLLHWEMLRFAAQDLQSIRHLSYSDRHLIKLICERVASLASVVFRPLDKEVGDFNPVATGAHLLQIRGLIEQVEEKVAGLVDETENESLQPALKVSKTSLGVAFPFFDRLKLEDVEKLAGASELPPIFRPVELTLVPDSVKTYVNVANALRHCINVCTSLAFQTDKIRNTHAMRFALIQHVFTAVIPLPVHSGHEHEAQCLWRQPMPYPYQVDILRSLAEISRHLAISSLSLNVTRSTDATRIITMACLAAVADVVARTVASDIPSRFCLHLAGRAPGPSLPFAFDVGNFVLLSEDMEFTSPELSAARAQVIDYFSYQRARLREDHVIFQWEQSTELGPMARLLDQLCWDLGFDPSPDKLPLYLSGEIPTLTDFFPEMACYRDIVFTFKYLMSNLDELPELKAWEYGSARLFWSYTPKQGFTVKAFGGKKGLVCTADERLVEAPGGKVKSRRKALSHRGIPSAANPSFQCGEVIKSEDDVLHIKDLPSFDGQLNPRDSELLISYLTAPYLRIPLVLAFFSTQEKIKSLSSKKLQALIDATLFEPGNFRPLEEGDCPDMVPLDDRIWISTSCGLLLNELQVPSTALLDSVENLLTIALDMDTGHFANPTSDTILYIVRLVIRVESFMQFLINHNKWVMSNQVSGSRWQAWVRGLTCLDSVLVRLEQTKARLRAVLDTTVFTMLERWCDRATAANDMPLACLLRAHLAYIFRNVEESELNEKVVSTLLSAQAFLTARHSFTLDHRSAKKPSKKKIVTQDRALEIPDNEIFELFQRHRGKVLNWLDNNQAQRNEVMEAVVRVVTLTGTRTGNSVGNLAARTWINMDGENCRGRFIPEPPKALDDKADKKPPMRPGKEESYQDFLRRRQDQDKVDTEVNMQIGLYTLKMRPLEPLDDEICLDPDFIRVVGESKGPVPCAEVRNTSTRQWVRLVGRRFDVQYWAPDSREAPILYDREYNATGLHQREAWIAQVLESTRAQRLQDVALFLPKDRYPEEAHIAHLYGLRRNQPLPEGKEKEKGEKVERSPMTIKELVVFRNPGVVHVYDVCEHGRHWYRSLVYTSDPAFCYQDLFPAVTARPDRRFQWECYKPYYEAGDATTIVAPAYSLVITRNFSVQEGVQKYIPDRFLQGLIPSTLLNDFVFWQNSDGSLAGYAKDAAMGQPPAIKVTTNLSAPLGLPTTATAARISRTFPENPNQVYVLLDLLYAPAGSPLADLRTLLLRFENLSHCLVWTRDRSGAAGASGEYLIDLIELPRMKLSFKAEEKSSSSDGATRFFSSEHAGLFISNHRCERTNKLVQGLPHSLLLENANGELFVLLPAGAMPSRAVVQTDVISCDLVFDRRNQRWISSLDVLHYLYPIHLSRMFLTPPTFASGLYLLYLRFLQRQHEIVFSMADLCITDLALTNEEAQIWDQFVYLTAAHDSHPNAYACRIKLILCCLDSPLVCPWTIAKELEGYLLRIKHVSMACRLSIDEERIAIGKCSKNEIQNSYELLNRRSQLKGYLTSQESFTPYFPHRIVVEEFDNVEDRTCLQEEGSAKLSYTRPQDAEGLEVLSALGKWPDSSWRLEGGKNNLGFLFFYELMTGTLNFRLLPGDSCFELANLLIRFLPASEVRERSVYMSLLRLLSSDPKLSTDPDLPKFKDTRMVKLFAGGHGKLFKDIKAFLGTKQNQFQWPKIHTPPAMSTHLPLPPFGNLLQMQDFSCARRDLHIGSGNLPITEDELKAFSSFCLQPIGLSKWVVGRSRSDQGQSAVDSQLPFSVRSHPYARSQTAISMLGRLEEDARVHAEIENSAQAPTLLNFFPTDIAHYLANPGDRRVQDATRMVEDLIGELNKIRNSDLAAVEAGIPSLLQLANCEAASADRPLELAHSLSLYGGRSPRVTFEYLCGSFLSPTAEEELTKSRWVLEGLSNPIPGTRPSDLLQQLAVVMLRVNRVSQISRSLNLAQTLLRMIRSVSQRTITGALGQELNLQANTLAESLASRRWYMRQDKEAQGADQTLFFDPRFLYFEFMFNLLLRKSQVAMAHSLAQSVAAGESTCHQMIMGAGKTTVVAPLLALMVCDGSALVVQAVPPALLDFSRSVMQSCFKSVARKPVCTLILDRFSPVTEDLYSKLLLARARKAVIVSTPTAIKSFALRLVETLHTLDSLDDNNRPEAKQSLLRRIFGPGAAAVRDKKREEEALSAAKAELHAKADICVKILGLFRDGLLLLDEVDLILNPLLSELNWPLGEKEPIDFSRSPLGDGLRWEVPFNLLDAVFYVTYGRTVLEAVGESREVVELLGKLKAVCDEGAMNKVIQRVPHLVVLSKDWYHDKLRPLLARWLVIYLTTKKIQLGEDKILKYVLKGALGDREVTDAVHRQLGGEQIKLLNLCHDWLAYFLPFTLARIDRVSFGLLSPSDLEKALARDPKMPKSRRFLAVPFVGKDVPSHSSEFSHPDVTIGLTILAYRYEGLRPSDFKIVLENLVSQFQDESGPYHKRRTAKTFAKWVELSGGQVRGWTRRGKKAGDIATVPSAPAPSTTTTTTTTTATTTTITATTSTTGGLVDIWPLHLMELADQEQLDAVYNLLRNSPEVVWYYLSEFVFPPIMRHQGLKLSANAQALGSHLLFNRRLGFSGTANDLLPRELGSCQYEKGTDGRIMSVLTDPAVVTWESAPHDWSVESLLISIARASPPHHALIDTGALITGMTNLQVARFLLNHGLEGFDGVVFLDELDRKMILLRDQMQVVPLAQSGVGLQNRFTFFDQVHTTGMDIPQLLNASAVATLSKDITFRDLAQGCYRMRGIGRGQTIRLMVIPEVLRLIGSNMKLCEVKDSDIALTIPALPLSASSSSASLSTTGDGATGSTSGSGSANKIVVHTDGAMLKHVVAFAVLNSMRSEKMQFNLLCEQNIRNIWQKVALTTLITHHSTLGAPGVNSHTQKCIDVFRERMDLSVSNSVPQLLAFSNKLQKQIHEYADFVPKEEEGAVMEIRKIIVDGERAEAEYWRSLVESPDQDRAFSSEQVQEQEQEQEQQQQQQQEQEQEVVPVDDAPIEVSKKKYSREDEDPDQWPFTSLSSLFKDSSKGLPFLYQASEFTVCDIPATKSTPAVLPKPLLFPDFLLVSQNYFKQRWANGQQANPHRIKNAIAVLEVVPRPQSVIVSPPAAHRALSKDQETRLKHAFAMFDAASKGSLNVVQTTSFLAAVDGLLDVKDGESLSAMIAALLFAKSGDKVQIDLAAHDQEVVAWEAVKHIMVHNTFARMEQGRYFTLLSLSEAESVRVLLHRRGLQGKNQLPVIAGSDCFIALHHLGGHVLDATAGYKASSSYQKVTADECYRFMDSEMHYEQPGVNLLLRALELSPQDLREQWFAAIHACRRRLQKSWRQSPVNQVFAMKDQFDLLLLKAALAKIKVVLAERGLLLLDAFRAFDHNRNGLMEADELYGGVTWLGVELSSPEALALYNYLNWPRHGKGLTYKAFARALRDPASWVELQATLPPEPITFKRVESNEETFTRVTVPPRKIDAPDSQLGVPGSGLADKKKSSSSSASLPQSTSGSGSGVPVNKALLEANLEKVTVKLKKLSSFDEVWSTVGSRARAKVSVWVSPENVSSSLLGTKSHVVCLGHFPVASFQNPKQDKRERFALEFSMPKTAGVALEDIVEMLLPHPVKYQQVWRSEGGGGAPVYAWHGIPPDQGHTCVGALITSSPDEPKLEALRCVPLRWLMPTSSQPTKVWDDTGLGGRKGSFWMMSQLGTLVVADSHEKPEGIFYDIWSDKPFKANSGLF